MFAGNFAPRSWALCDGQLLAISQNDALFSLLGTIYGGDGRTTFHLPDMRGRVPLHWGSGPGLTPRTLGHKSGNESVTLTMNQLPSHNHGGTLNATTGNANTRDPGGKAFATSVGGSSYRNATGRGSNPQLMNSAEIQLQGGSQQHTNMAPFQCLNFIIALYGVYPSRN